MVYIRDPGVTHTLAGIHDRDALLGHPSVGPSWEGFVIEQIAAVVPDGTRLWFYRTSAGAEIDLLLDFGRERWAVDISRSLGHPQPRKGFYLASDDVAAARRIVVYPGTERFKLDQATEVMPVTAMLNSRWPR